MDRLRRSLGSAPSAREAAANTQFAVLPRQSEDELLLSEVHTKLDGALQFLRSSLGNLLLDDAHPAPGGAVGLGCADSASSRQGFGRSPERLPAEEPRIAEEEARQVVRISSETAKYAEFPDDFVLVWRFVTLVSESFPENRAEKVKTDMLCRIVLQGIRLMHLCRYHYSDVVVTLAYASVYFKTVQKSLGDRMSSEETAHVVMLLVFLAHCFVLDENCPLRCWQKYIFRKYCTLKVLDQAVFRIFQMRKFQLIISEEEEASALTRLLATTDNFDVVLKVRDSKGFNGKVLSSGATASTLNGHTTHQTVNGLT